MLLPAHAYGCPLLFQLSRILRQEGLLYLIELFRELFQAMQLLLEHRAMIEIQTHPALCLARFLEDNHGELKVVCSATDACGEKQEGRQP